MNCPNCKTEISRDHLNITTDVGQCQNCGHIFKISENLNSDIDDGFNINNPPNGSWIVKDSNQILIGATTRSVFAFFLVPFMIVWSGVSIGGIYGSQIMSGEFSVFLSLFGIPFIIGAIIFWAVTLMSIWGKVELTLDQFGGKIFTGVGIIGITKKFTWNEISTIKEVESKIINSQKQGGEILLEGKKRISFGNGVSESRRYYLFRTMRILLSKVKANKNFMMS